MEENKNINAVKNIDIENTENIELIGKKEEVKQYDDNGNNIKEGENNLNIQNNNENEQENIEENNNFSDNLNSNIEKENNIDFQYENKKGLQDVKEDNLNLQNENLKQEKNISIEYVEENKLGKNENDEKMKIQNQIIEQIQENSNLDKNNKNADKSLDKKEKKNEKKFKKSKNYNQKIIKNKNRLIKGQKATLFNKVYSHKFLNNNSRLAKKNINKSFPMKNQSNSFKFNERNNRNNRYKSIDEISNKYKNEESNDNNSSKVIQIRKSKINIFNNKKNNCLCSELLKSAMKNEKELYLIPYAKTKQKINKTFHAIGDANGISYPNISVVNGILPGNKNYMNIIRDDNRKSNITRKSKKLVSSLKKKSLNQSNQSNFGNNSIEINKFNM